MNKVETVSLKKLEPYYRNPVFTEANLKAVKQSIKDYGYNQYISVDKDKTIVTGHCRYQALKDLEYKKVEVIVLDLPEEKIQEYRLIDNATADLREYDHEALMNELKDIYEDLDMQIYFPDVDYDAIHAELGKATKMPSQDSINTEKAKQEDKFNKLNEKATDDYIDITCPHCGEQFVVRRRDILTHR